MCCGWAQLGALPAGPTERQALELPNPVIQPTCPAQEGPCGVLAERPSCRGRAVPQWRCVRTKGFPAWAPTAVPGHVPTSTSRTVAPCRLRQEKTDTVRCIKSCRPGDMACIRDPVHTISHTVVSLPTFREFSRPEGEQPGVGAPGPPPLLPGSLLSAQAVGMTCRSASLPGAVRG